MAVVAVATSPAMHGLSPKSTRVTLERRKGMVAKSFRILVRRISRHALDFELKSTRIRLRRLASRRTRELTPNGAYFERKGASLRF